MPCPELSGWLCAGISLKTAYLYAIVFSCRCASPLAARPPPARSLPLPLLLRSAASSACKPAGGANAHCQARRGADLDLITMWFIELPAGTSLWEYTSVRQQPAVPAQAPGRFAASRLSAGGLTGCPLRRRCTTRS